MTDPTPLYWTVLDRLVDDDTLDEHAKALVEAALGGDAGLARALEGDAALPDRTQSHATPRPQPRGAYLDRLTVSGFRGIGPEVTLDLHAGPGLTLVVGRNGSGKSSLAEGLEALLTGDSQRWAGRSKVWQDGWRNLHSDTSPALTASFLVEGESAPIKAQRHWSEDGALDSAPLKLFRSATPLDGLAALGWSDALTTFRPFLSYNELGGLLEGGPTRFFDQVHTILGLEQVSQAKDALGRPRLHLEKGLKALKKDAGALVERLSALDDPRARASADALSARKYDLDAIETAVLGDGTEAASDAELTTLRRLASLRLPDDSTLHAAAVALRDAVQAQADLAHSRSGHAHLTAQLVQQALRWHTEVQIAECPVCGSPDVLDNTWRQSATHLVEALTAQSTQARLVETALQNARRRAAELAHLPDLQDGGLLGEVAAQARAAASHWRAAPRSDLECVDHLRTAWPDTRDALGALREAARVRLAQREDAWKPLATALAGWLDRARQFERQAPRLKRLKAAEAWLKDQEGSLRDDRFAPIAERVVATWDLLRQESNVSLVTPKLAGTASRRRVELDVQVDGQDSVALGVMSQGELHALALSLFLPRLTLDESPFRFVVIDDPVQAMDPHKVDGLATVLNQAAQTRQVIVFTHDARLPDAVRRLGLDARVVQVQRRAGSVVELRERKDPIYQYLSDARAVVDDALRMGPDLPAAIVPGLCRSALEAALTRLARRKLLLDGVRHDEAEQRIHQAGATNTLAALAFFGDEKRGGDVLGHLNKRGAWMTDHYQALRKGTHKGHKGELTELIEQTRRMVRELLGIQ